MSYLFTSESVSEGHPDKIADQISDAMLDNFLAFDENSKVAIETMVTTGQVIIAGEVKTKYYIDVQDVSRDVIKNIGYTKSDYQFDYKSCGILSAIHGQSPDIHQGVERVEEDNGAGDQGIMFGYAVNETDNYMPLPLELSHQLLIELSDIRKNTDLMPYLRPDSKSQVTVEYNDDGTPLRINTIVISTQHDEFSSENIMLKSIEHDIIKILIPRMLKRLNSEKINKLFDNNITYHINPTGKFVIGGPHGDTGLTGRKIIVDTYGGKGAHGGGAFSGKDPSKVDRSAAYAARHIAKNMVAAGVSDEILIQLSYAIGVAEPISIFVDTYGKSKIKFSDSEIAEKIKDIFILTPSGIINRLGLKSPIYLETAKYGHFGRTPYKETKYFNSPDDYVELNIEYFTWEKLDYVNKIKKTFNL